MSTIFITEKPSVAQEYRKVLKVSPGEKTNGYIEGFSPVMKTNVIITWAVGHLIGICSPERQNEDWKAWKKDTLPMLPKNFKYEPLSGTAEQFRIVKSLYTRKDIDCIYYAGDSGREGIYIQALIRNQIFKTAPKFSEKVVWIDSFTEDAILKGISEAKPYSDYQPMIDAGYARAKDDWLIGMNLSRAFTLTSGGYGNMIAVGRVMTPTLAMVVNRQNEIDNFQKTDFYGISAGGKINWKATKQSKFFESDLLYNENGFLKEEDAKKLITDLDSDKHLRVSDVKVQNKTEYAPLLFNLADLQSNCSRIFKFSPADTLKIAQELYEKKFTTYPRTDCRYLSSAVAAELKSKHGYDVPKRYVDDSKITDHYAIIPTFYGNADSLSGMTEKVYKLILERFMNTMKPPFIYDAVSVMYLHKNGEPFYEAFRVVKQQGFKKKLDDEDIASKPIPKQGDIIPANFSIRSMETKPPTAFTSGSLVIAMERAGRLLEEEELKEQLKTCGIGTSATRANIIEKLKADNFIIVNDDTQKVAPTDKGKQVISIVAKFDETLASPIKTAEMEQQLQMISESTLSPEKHQTEIETYLRNTVKTIFENNTEKITGGTAPAPAGSYTCPHCKGAVAKSKFGWFCRAKCGMNLSKVFKHELTDAQITRLLSGKETSYTENGRKTIVLPSVKKNEWEGKTYYYWETKSGGFTSQSGSGSGNKSSSNAGWRKK